MALAVLLAGLLLAGCGAANPPAMAALAPRTRARQVALCLFLSAVFSYVGLLLLAAPVLSELWPRVGLSALCRRLLVGPGPLGTVGTCLAAGVVAASAWTVAATVRRCHRDRRALRVEFGIGRHEFGPRYDLVTVPSPVPLAYCLAGRQWQVVVSQGLRSRLGARELAAVVAHEEAHLRCGHHRWLGLVAVLEGALWFAPWARAAGSALRLSLERWADEEAVRRVGREPLRSALLAAADAAPLSSQAAGLTSAGALAQRLAGLAERGPGDPPAAGWLRFAVGLTAAAVSGGGLVAVLATLAHLCRH